MGDAVNSMLGSPDCSSQQLAEASLPAGQAGTTDHDSFGMRSRSSQRERASEGRAERCGEEQSGLPKARAL